MKARGKYSGLQCSGTRDSRTINSSYTRVTGKRGTDVLPLTLFLTTTIDTEGGHHYALCQIMSRSFACGAACSHHQYATKEQFEACVIANAADLLLVG